MISTVGRPRTDLRNRLPGGITPDDIATTTRVLDLITQRVRGMHAAR
ncbi:hypothetical protein AB0I53_20300 [Saccharopolyspora sp. NPDC050389]